MGKGRVGVILAGLRELASTTLAMFEGDARALIDRVACYEALPSRMQWEAATAEEKDTLFNGYVDRIRAYENRHELTMMLILVTNKKVVVDPRTYEDEHTLICALETFAAMVMVMKLV